MPKEPDPKSILDLTSSIGLISFNGADVRVRNTSDFFILEVDPATSTTAGLFAGSPCLAGCGLAKPGSGSGSCQLMESRTGSARATAGLTGSGSQVSSAAFLRHLAFAFLFLFHITRRQMAFQRQEKQLTRRALRSL